MWYGPQRSERNKLIDKEPSNLWCGIVTLNHVSKPWWTGALYNKVNDIWGRIRWGQRALHNGMRRHHISNMVMGDSNVDGYLAMEGVHAVCQLVQGGQGLVCARVNVIHCLKSVIYKCCYLIQLNSITPIHQNKKTSSK